MKSFKIDGVLFEWNYYGSIFGDKQFSRKNSIKNKDLFVIIKDLFYRKYSIFNVNYFTYYKNRNLELECYQILFSKDSFFQGSAKYRFYRKDILYYSSNLDLIIKKVESLNLLS